ncbi:MAG: precorrin-2 C(20)-methyltransferase [Stomatobaculum sp.]|nr:precorrin-2 C(20)-methyltransferase [Stomatobaculum sp.]
MAEGILYGIGVGPGDPELMTLKAVRLLKEADLIAAPGKDVRETAAFGIAVQAVPEIAEKELFPVEMPMAMDREALEEAHRAGAKLLEDQLAAGKTVAFITLGDPTVYSTFSYLERKIRADGFRTEYVSGVTSFCAAAAALRVPLAEWQEPVHIIPAVHKRPGELLFPGNCVLMKSGNRMKEVKEYLREQERAVWMGVNVGMPGETLYRSLDEMPDEAGYFALIIAKEAPEEDRQ